MGPDKFFCNSIGFMMHRKTINEAGCNEHRRTPNRPANYPATSTRPPPTSVPLPKTMKPPACHIITSALLKLSSTAPPGLAQLIQVIAHDAEDPNPTRIERAGFWAHHMRGPASLWCLWSALRGSTSIDQTTCTSSSSTIINVAAYFTHSMPEVASRTHRHC